MNRLMIVDDEVNVLSALRRLLERNKDAMPLEIECFSDPVAAMARLSVAPFDAILCDYRMPGVDGVQVLMHAKAVQPDSVRLILSAQADLGALIRAINDAQIFRFLSKPWDDSDLALALAEAFRTRTDVLDERRLADAERVRTGSLSEEQRVQRELEREEPGITHVSRDQDGAVLLDEDLRKHIS